MNAFLRFSLIAAVVLGGAGRAAEPDPFAAAVDRTAADFNRRLEAATQELAAARERIAREATPLQQATGAAEARITALGAEIAALQSAHAQAEATRRRLQRDAVALQKNLSYLNTLGRDSLKGLNDGLLPGEAARFADRIAALSARLDAGEEPVNPAAAIETAELLLGRLRQQLGGSAVPGRALIGRSNTVAQGTFLFLGPEVFFTSDQPAVAGTVRMREGSPFPIAYPVPDWSAAQARALATGAPGTIPADASGGKALQLRETTGTVFEHINRGGPVAYLIIGVGLFACGLALQKAFELRRLEVDPPAAVQAVLQGLFDQPPDEARRAVAALHGATRELLALGLRQAGKPKEVLEEHLFAFTLRQRLHYERRLPLLAVIATASPLMGLLGTVMGMIKTFALITVFGTGNAAKLSSGISEVLVTTELGLTVAIPTLVVHGFLAHRAQKKLSQLERYAVEFAAAAGEGRRAEPNGVRLSA